MALALGVREGTLIDVGDHRIEVKYVRGLTICVLPLLKRTQRIEELWLDDRSRAEIFPSVFVSTARSKNDDGLTRLLLEAPKEIKILRL